VELRKVQEIFENSIKIQISKSFSWVNQFTLGPMAQGDKANCHYDSKSLQRRK
jgi:hypothetical protein